MKILRSRSSFLLLVLTIVLPGHVDGFGRTAFDASRLDQLARELAERNTKAFRVVHQGEVIFEWYAPDAGPRKRHYTASLAKALVGGVSLMLALEEGRLRTDDPAWLYIPAWGDHGKKELISIRHLATHSSGLEDAEQDGIPHMELPGWKGRFWRRDPDPFTPAIHDAPVLFPPGTEYAYSNPGVASLAYAITSSLPAGGNIRSLLKERVMDPLQIAEEEWSIGYGQGYEVDGMELYGAWGGGSFSPRAVSRIGQWMLQRGNWEGRQLVAPEWVDRVTRYAGTPLPSRTPENPEPGSGLGWWVNFDRVWERLPADAFAGAGAGQQLLLVVPSLSLVVVRNGGMLTEPGEGLGFWGGIEEFIFNPLMDAIPDYAPGEGLRWSAPYPPSPRIERIQFAEKDEIVRRASGSDNWPVTWRANGEMVGAYGDGWGFAPKVEKKLSLGLVRILGQADDFQGINLRSSSAEQIGQGSEGKKASGMLDIDGRIYMWVRNADNAQLAWSDDDGETWNWSQWRMEDSFGHPAFINFGRGYSGARSNYVYIYSHDSDSAYEPGDRMVLARVPRAEVTDRTAYEFFVEMGEEGPRWSTEISARGAVFENPGQCYRSSISYSPGLERYLWVQILPGISPRFTGGFGIYDAPEPWGPWTTAFYTEQWDVGPGENAHFPTKWMESKTLYLLFSGDDSFSVRRADVVLARE